MSWIRFKNVFLSRFKCLKTQGRVTRDEISLQNVQCNYMDGILNLLSRCEKQVSVPDSHAEIFKVVHLMSTKTKGILW